MTTASIREADFRLLCRGGDTTLLSATPSVRELLGYGTDEFLAGRVSLPRLIHGDDQDIAAQLFSPHPDHPEGECNLRVRHANGRIICVKCRYRRESRGAEIALDLRLQDARTLPRTLVDIAQSAYSIAEMENTDDFIYFKDRNHVFTGASQTLVGLTTEVTHWTEFIGLTDYDVFPEESADRFYRLEKQVFAGVSIAREVQEIISKDGEKGWVDNRKYPIHDERGTIIGLHGIARDITRAVSAESALRESEAKARAIIQVSPMPMATNDGGLRVTLVNPAFTKTFGYEISDIPTLADWWPKAYPDPVYRQWVMDSWQAELTRADQTGTAFEPLEVRIRCKDGSDRLTLASAAPIGRDFAEDYLVVLQDITAFKRAEQQLQKTASALAEAQRIARIGSWEFQSSSGAMTWSEELYRIFAVDPGAPPPEYPDHERFLKADSAKKLDAAVRSCLATGASYELELEIVRADGSQGWILARGERMEDDQGSSTGLRGVVLDISERKRAVLALVASEERWRFAVDGAGDGAWDWDIPSGAVTYSKRWIEMLGYEAHEIPPTIDAWGQLAHPDDAGRVLADVQLHFDGRTSSSSNEYRMRCKDGTWKWILGRGLVVARDANGAALRMIGTNSDISARKQSELELSRSRQSLAEAQRLAHIGSWELDARTGQMSFSDELFRVLEFDPSAPIPSLDAHELLYTPESWEKLRSSIEQAQRTGRPYEIELERRMRDGSQGWLLARGEVLTDEDGATVGLRGVAQDITERKRAEATLRLSDMAIRSISQGVIITGPDRLIISVNDAFCAITGYREEEAIGRDCNFLVGPLTNPVTTAALRAALHDKTKFSGEIQHHRKDGTPFWNELSVSPVFNVLGDLTHFICVTRDISSRKRMEQENAEIEAQLQQSQRLETVGTLAAGIAHDFNNILAAIVGNAELAVVDMDEAHPAREHLLEIGKASTRAKALVQQVLAFSSQHSQSRHPLALGPVILEATALLRATIPASARIVTSVDEDAPNVLADAGQMHQIVINLCTNAWHALGNRPGTIGVHLKAVSLGAREASELGGLEPGHYACLSVRDDGKGMDAATRQRIFDPFFTTKEPGKGTGLGLSVVHGIIAAHKGVIQVVSAPSEGATFNIYLPATDLVGVAAAPVSSAAKPHPELRGRILYIDDEDMLIRVATRTLQRLGYQVTGFLSPVEALQCFSDDPSRFDAVITDMNMPQSDGLTVARALREIRPDIPIVLVSGSIDQALRLAAVEAGIVDMLAKPFTIQELHDTVARLRIHAGAGAQ